MSGSGKQEKNISKLDTDNVEFVAARQLLEKTNQSVFLTGKAGTGKSTFLRHLTTTTRKKYIVLAPTGIAAVNVGGQTLHSFFKIPLKPLLPIDPEFAVGRLRNRLKYSKQTIKLIRELELIIIDEISMVRADVIDFIDKVLRVYSGNMREPFGGKQMLFVGDVFQLEPVVTGNDRDILANSYSSFYFFNAHVFRDIKPVPIELTKVYRQEELDFVRLLDKIRMGQPSQADIKAINSRYVPGFDSTKVSDDFIMTIASRRDMVDNINERHLAALDTPSVVYRGNVEGDFPLSALPTDMELELKVGAQVVFVKNDPDRRWVNGTVAVVDTCLPDLIVVRTEDGEKHEVLIEKWSNVKYIFNEKTHKVDEIELGSFMQYPLKLAWALTIHKSQGLTFNKVVIDLGSGAFTGGQTYVALSRSRSLDGITLAHPVAFRDIYVKREIMQFASTFNSSVLIEKALNRSEAQVRFLKAKAAFDQEKYGDAINLVMEGLSLMPEVIQQPAVQRLMRIKALKLEEKNRKIALLEQQLAENDARFATIAQRYVDAANDLAGEGWEIDAAIAQYDKALEISPDYPPAILGKARMFVKAGMPDDAYNMFVLFARTGASNAWQGYIGMAEISESDGDDFNVIANLLKAHEMAPRQPEPLKRLIDTYRRLKDFESAQIYKRKLARLQK